MPKRCCLTVRRMIVRIGLLPRYTRADALDHARPAGSEIAEHQFLQRRRPQAVDRAIVGPHLDQREDLAEA